VAAPVGALVKWVKSGWFPLTEWGLW